MTEEEIKKELNRCLGCKIKPCEKACPLNVSPHDFIALAKSGDYASAAADIAKHNPLPQTCGLVCPDKFCQKSCIRKRIDSSIEIPCLQAKIIERGGLPKLELPTANGKKSCIIGGGPAGLGALYEFLINGWQVDLYEKEDKLGGAARLIPTYRLPAEVLDKEIQRLTDNERVTIHLKEEITDYTQLANKYDAIVMTIGEPNRRNLGIKGEEFSLDYALYLSHPEKYQFKKVAVVGGGEVALDCAISLRKNGAKEVAMFVRRRKEDMRIMEKDFKELENHNINIQPLKSITEITPEGNTFTLKIINNRINDDGKAEAISDSEYIIQGYDKVIMALGSYYPKEKMPQDIMCAGDMTGNCGTIVEALASGRNAAKQLINQESEK